jgi:SAM-dependent methyltransferase
MSENFYKAFEDRYRGSRDTIKQRQSAYLPFLLPLARLHAPATALDLGCGRGEWLELANGNGFAARGVDLDDGMLSSCRERGLQVETADAIGTLRALPANSVALVSAFHLIEHIPFEAVHELIREALRVLQPGGLLIMETPNPENLSVGAHTFYRDPSHLRPLPPELMLFAVEFNGFARQRIVRLQEDPALRGAAVTRLQQVLDGVSPDYAIIGQKAAAPAALAAFDSAFAADFGLSFEFMAQRYDRQEDLKARELAGVGSGLKELESHVAPLVERRQSADAELLRLFALADKQGQQIDADRGAAREQHAQLRGMIDHHYSVQDQRFGAQEHRASLLEQRIADSEARNAAADARAEALARQVIEMLASRSWRITAPLRAVTGFAYRLRNAVRNGTLGPAVKRRVRTVLTSVGQRMLRNRTAKRVALAMLVPFPRLQARLRGVIVGALLEASLPTEAPQVPDQKLSPRARQLYGQLQQAFKQKDQ